MSLYPPPRMPSPQLVPAALPSPPAFPRRVSSRSRLHLPPHLNDPPIPPRLVGSPLLEKLVHPDPATLTPKIQKQLWFDGDEFGTRRSTQLMQTEESDGFPFSRSSPSPPRSPSSRRFHRRTSSIAPVARARSHSPPPPQQSSAVSIPPVPPIPSSAFNTPGAKRPVLRTPPPSTSRARPVQIIIPDLSSDSTHSFTPNAFSSPVLRPHHSRASASPRRRGLGCKSL
ncbi:hypothetical protein LXA43DRAFT_67064 [Ganoderma leucocontextum]|nr:hypothetical protein LXA43DRAFT_67064 [Ganoderma leucocontextum]